MEVGGIGSGRKARALELVLKDGKSHLTKRQIRERREAEKQLRPPADDIKPPTWLDAAAKREWRRLAPILEELGILTNVDLNVLAVYCDAVARYAQCARIIRKEKLVILSAMGGKTQHPAILAQKKYAETMRQAASELGLTPAARAKMAIPRKEKEPQEDPFEKRFGSTRSQPASG